MNRMLEFERNRNAIVHQFRCKGLENTASMKKRPRQVAQHVFLGIECGGTRTVTVMVSDDTTQLNRMEFGPCNLRLVNDAELRGRFVEISKECVKPSAIGIGMAGVRDEDDHGRIVRAAEETWPGVPCSVSHDLETALYAAECSGNTKADARVIVLSGTGSCCYGRSVSGAVAKVGGWGHLIGDKGSGYEIGLRAMKAVVFYYDRDGVWPQLGQRISRALQLSVPNDFIDWAQNAGKNDIAALAVEVFGAWSKRDKIARDILEGAAHSLAKDAAACARRLTPADSRVAFAFTGSVLVKQPKFHRLTAKKLREIWPLADISTLKAEGAWGAAIRAKDLFQNQHVPGAAETAPAASTGRVRHQVTERSDFSLPAVDSKLPPLTATSPTERRNPRSMNLDRLALSDAITLMIKEDSRIPNALLAKRPEIERAIRLIVTAFRQDGRLFYVGAGTSGRLGVLDASECPPTFRTPADQIQGIIAGGQQALWKSIEGAEDSPQLGAEAIRCRGICRKDIVVGIAASGRTPFVWGALEEAKRRKAKTILICFNPNLALPAGISPDLIIAPNVGPELLTGSTRLKAGTATKQILNILTTLSMVRLGKVASNLMIDLNPSNTKLKDRAIRIVQNLTGKDRDTAHQALQTSGWIIKNALKSIG